MVKLFFGKIFMKNGCFLGSQKAYHYGVKPFLDEFVDKTIKFIQEENQGPDIVHGHYADGEYVTRELAGFASAAKPVFCHQTRR